MEIRDVPFTQNLDKTLQMLQKHGLLLTSAGSDGAPNVMTIGWGNPGIIWGREVFIVLVRPSRLTFDKIEQTGEFVVNVPRDDMDEACLKCGTVSGRDVDKFEDQGLKIVPAEHVKAPLIGQCERFYECRVVHRNDVLDAEIDAEIRSSAYAGGDFHRLYYGQVLRTAERA
jgi:flavin reductase (DIM6/NTAB) family NADH-FMN oxidoreductase RutF